MELLRRQRIIRCLFSQYKILGRFKMIKRKQGQVGILRMRAMHTVTCGIVPLMLQATARFGFVQRQFIWIEELELMMC